MMKVFAQASIVGTTAVPASKQGKGKASGAGLAAYVARKGKTAAKGKKKGK